MGKIVEGLWDCRYCDTKAIKGRYRECPNCGRPRDDTVKFYLPSDIKSNYVKEEVTKKINKNPDWLCSYCDSLNSANNYVCVSCGASRTAESLDYFSCKEENTKIELENNQYQSDLQKYGSYEKNYDYLTSQNTVSSVMKNNWKKLIFIPIILALVTALIFIFIPKEKEVIVTNLSWERVIEIDKLKTVNESGWTLPAGARLQYTREEVKEYEPVLDYYETRTSEVSRTEIVGYEPVVVGYEDLGNGYFEEIIENVPEYETFYDTEVYEVPVYRDEPVYATKYYYEIDKWLYERSVITTGFDKEPYFGEVVLNEKEREDRRYENYYIYTHDSEKISVPYNQWLAINLNDTIKIKVSIFGSGEIIS